MILSFHSLVWPTSFRVIPLDYSFSSSPLRFSTCIIFFSFVVLPAYAYAEKGGWLLPMEFFSVGEWILPDRILLFFYLRSVFNVPFVSLLRVALGGLIKRPPSRLESQKE